MRIWRGLFALVLLAGIGWASLGRGQEPAGFAGNKVTPLIKIDLTGAPNKQVIANVYEVPAGAMVPRHLSGHSHPPKPPVLGRTRLRAQFDRGCALFIGLRSSGRVPEISRINKGGRVLGCAEGSRRSYYCIGTRALGSRIVECSRI
jgi:hypothetical protein